MADGKVIDEVVQPLGVRKYEIVAGKGFFLNGEKYPMYGVTVIRIGGDWVAPLKTNITISIWLPLWMWEPLLSVLPTTSNQTTFIPAVIHWD